MKINAIKNLVERHSLDELRAATSQLEEEIIPVIEIEGADEGEQLTHLYAAVWVKEQMEMNGTDARTELRNFSQRVRNSIS